MSSAGQYQSLLVLWHFAIHVLIGVALFLIIYMPAYGLNLLVHWLSEGTDPVLLFVMWGAEYLLVIADSLLLLVFLGKATWRAMKEL